MSNPVNYLNNPRGPSFPGGGSKTTAYFHIREIREYLRHLETNIAANNTEATEVVLNELLGLVESVRSALFPEG